MKTNLEILIDELKVDEDYKEYSRIFEEKYLVNKELLSKLLKKHEDLYYQFLKINTIFLNVRYENKSLEKKLENCKIEYNDNFMQLIVDYQLENRFRCKRAIQKIIIHRLRPSEEFEILKKIYKWLDTFTW